MMTRGLPPLGELKRTKDAKDAKRKSDLPPFEKLRRAFIIGRPSEVQHSIVSGVSAAQDELKRLEEKIAEMKLECAAQVCVVVSTSHEREGKWYPVNSSPHHAAKVISDIATLPDPQVVGLVYAVVDTQTRDFEFWTKAFIKGRQTEKLLDLAVLKGLRRMGIEEEARFTAKGETMTQKHTPEVTKFLADAQAWPWESFYLVTMDGSFFPASADVAVLDAAVLKLGCAGYIGYAYKKSTNHLVQMVRPYGVESDEARAALESAADGLRLDAVICNEKPETGELSN